MSNLSNEKKPILLVMAAGMGSRYGGIKQIDPITDNGCVLLDFGIYDALKANFGKIVFVIRRDIEKDFRERLFDRIARNADAEYVFQEKTGFIPSSYLTYAEGRTKPWGTGQAILCCKDVVKEPFLVINADDYYGKQAYVEAYHELTGPQTEVPGKLNISMVGFVLKNTLSENGGVTRGVCKVDENHMLKEIVETKNIVKAGEGAKIVSEEGEREIDINSAVSMNMWGLYPDFFDVLEKGFTEFLAGLNATERKEEYLLPTIIGGLLKEQKVQVKVLESKDKWFGVTYKEDKESVVQAIQKLVQDGEY